ncbi:sphingosine N-acyltransferase subunit LIP1 NDAI_0C03680 [Naumovozyma dairenensis CBS 421]|uniref:Ceramide synthase subunit LIP1 n=1 Tax=Naumovozyma dairenensis (strain ATCC 10597 / BCRC 20456 / CBS 421 / NBRC 0211 / NRRL Y-12639) TaxID=1071378 RepID=G0W8B7_NAUDC|nr:hypothetical protein NDAI_0C03680 [Naumovozyma dairenensis CBS 421]CCD24028.1 hypothetical protein NDAI_0C03680 [Naumovozyma dairenensis CBS 421]
MVDPKLEKVLEERKPRFWTLFQCVVGALTLMAAVEYFKYSTRIHYEWFHCTPVIETVGGPSSSVIKLYSRGGPSCDKRGEFKTIVKRITRDYEPAEGAISFCINENVNVPAVHYPIDENKGAPGYVAFVGYDSDGKDLIEQMCEGSTILHM